MSPELTWLAWTAALTAVLWVPYIVARSLVVEMPNPRLYRDPTPPEMPDWIKRCDRAHVNAVESLAPFAVLVLIGHVAGLPAELSAPYAMVFFYARLAHAVVYWLGVPFVRTAAFAVGLLATLGLFYHIVTAVPA